MWQTWEVSSTLVIPVCFTVIPYIIENLLSATATLFNTLT